MKNIRVQARDDVDDLASPQSILWAIGGVAVGTALALVVLHDVAPALAASLSGPQPKTWWYLSRASGLVAYALLSASMLLGLSLSTKLAKTWPGNATAFALHQHASALGLALALFHSIVLLGDRHTTFTVAELLLPFGAAYRPLALGFGQVALYVIAFLVGSFYVRKRVGQRVWRLIHFASFAAFGLALIHGLVAGSDQRAMLVGLLFASVVLFFGIYRTLAQLFGREHASVGRSTPVAPHRSRS